MLAKLSSICVHGADLGGLHGLDVVREHGHVHFLAGERRGEEVGHHLERAVVVLDHQRQELRGRTRRPWPRRAP